MDTPAAAPESDIDKLLPDIGRLASREYRESVADDATYAREVELFQRRQETRRAVCITRAAQLFERKEELIREFGGKAFSIMVLECLAESGDFKVPKYELIGTQLFKDVVARLRLDEYKTECERASEALLAGITVENLLDTDEFISYCEYYGTDPRNYEIERDEVTGQWTYTCDDPMSYNAGPAEELLEAFKAWYKREKDGESKAKFCRRYIVDRCRERGDNMAFPFPPEELAALQAIYEKFKDFPFIVVRSSADCEDGSEHSYSGKFYSGFCATDNFTAFLDQVGAVYFSVFSGAVEEYQRQHGLTKQPSMGIIVMPVIGEFQDEPERYSTKAPTPPLDRGSLSMDLVDQHPFERGRLFYPDSAGVVHSQSPFDPTKISIFGARGLGTSVCSGNDRGGGTGSVQLDTTDTFPHTITFVLNKAGPAGRGDTYRQIGKQGLVSDREKKTIIAYTHEDTFIHTNMPSRMLAERGTGVPEDDEERFAWEKRQPICRAILPHEQPGLMQGEYVPHTFAQVQRIADIAKYIERGFGGKPLDIEYVFGSIAAEDLCIVQARPLTGVMPRPSGLKPPDPSKIEPVLSEPPQAAYGFVDNVECVAVEVFAMNGDELTELIKKARKEIGDDKTMLVIMRNNDDVPLYMPKGNIIYALSEAGFWGLGSHAVNCLREQKNPFMVLTKNGVRHEMKQRIFGEEGRLEKPRIGKEPVKVYIDGSNGAVLYFDKAA